MIEINPYNVATGAMGRYSRAGTFGFNDNVGATEATIWSEGGIYAYPPSASVMIISSDDAADADAGTGAQTVEIRGLDENYLLTTEQITLDGITGVSTANSYIRIHRLTVLTAGTGEENAGKIYAGTGTLTAGVPANVYCAVPIGKNQSSMCIWTVPAGGRAYMTGVFTSTQRNASNTATIRVVARSEGQVFQTKGEFVISVQGGPIYAPFTIPLPLASKTDIEVRALASAANTDVSAAFLFMVGP